ncbi:unnamed protein product [Vitrella brassicaformis CCMP3155]|uniref:Uncharacterized protein n=3 Tax=Vitrella brassicaformis TaxID=1169539 RepID=A0A0G4GRP6_VITBC|nr:unnamed protein product [Vitrella brassicaformis CCMP3155]|mmetsp:Transcript_5385/g.12657  ORF Transcript_5385/g.12657 Transcript_5385/m.12657 type:complete len:103 (+) Transcript_5385:677-985(+)|eukprot:CEM33024.1 unnamed protein product [Vitrella brassicaformis CCMP3155]
MVEYCVSRDITALEQGQLHYRAQQMAAAGDEDDPDFVPDAIDLVDSEEIEIAAKLRGLGIYLDKMREWHVRHKGNWDYFKIRDEDKRLVDKKKDACPNPFRT